jgi:glycerol-3-phosphate dehydrogenase (NAD(P)+)
MAPGPRVAIVGAGAWGTTLAAIVARREPVTLLCHSAAGAEAITRTGRNERRLPGIELPDGIVATADASAMASAVDLVVSPRRRPICGPWSRRRPLTSRRRPTSCRSSRDSSPPRCFA